MGRRIVLLLAIAVGVTGFSVANAGIPDPTFCDVPNVLVNPGGDLQYTVFVANSSGPIDSALVQIVFSTEVDGFLCWCVGQTHPLIQGYSNASGEATFNIAAGGCVDPTLVGSPPAVEVLANGVSLAQVGVVGPDAVDDGGILPTSGWNPGGLCRVGLSDASRHTVPFSTFAYDYCSDLDSSGSVGLLDAVIATVPISTASACTQQ